MRAIQTLLFLFASLLIHAQELKLVLPIGHTGSIEKICFSPDGTRVLSAAADNNAKIWDAASGLMLAELAGHTSFITSASYSNNGKYMLTSSDDGFVNTWDAHTLSLLTSLGHYAPVYVARFNSDASKIITCTKSGMVKLWNASSGDLIFSYEENQDQVYDVAFSPDETMIVSSCADGTVTILDAETGKAKHVLRAHTGYVHSSEFSSDGKLVLTASDDQTAKLWNVETGDLILTLEHDSRVQSAIFSLDSKRIFTGSSAGSLSVWETATGKILHQIEDARSMFLRDIAYSKDGTKLATGSTEGKVLIWDANNYELIRSFRLSDRYIYSTNFSDDGKKVVAGYADASALIADLSTGEYKDLTGHSLAATVTVNQDGSRLSALLSNRSAALWDLNNGTLISGINGKHSVFHEKEQDINSAVFSNDGKHFVTAHIHSAPRIWGATDGKLIQELKAPDKWLSSSGYAEYNKDGSRLLSYSDKQLIVYSGPSFKTIAVLKGHKESVRAAYFSPDGKKIISRSFDSTVKIWDAISGKLLLNFNAMQFAVFSPDMRWIAAVTYNSLQLRDAATGKVIRTLPGDDFSYVTSLTFSSDGKHILAATYSSYYVLRADTWETLMKRELEDGLALASFNNNGTKIISATNKGFISIHPVEADPDYQVLDEGNGTEVISASFMPGDRYVITSAKDNCIRKWDTQTGKQVAFFFGVDSTDYFTQLPSRHYRSTPAAAKLLHYITPGMKVISFEQLDIQYNRPDMIMAALGNTDTAMMRSYLNAYAKRVRKLGIDTTSFHQAISLPEADFADRTNIRFEQKEAALLLGIQAKDAVSALHRFNVWVNDVPVFGSKGIDLSHVQRLSIDTVITLVLSQGDNRIETSVTNANGTESYRMPLFVKYTPVKKVMPKLHFIGIGINHFQDTSQDLDWSVKDIRDLSLKLQTRYPGMIIDTLFDQDVTKENILALKSRLHSLSEDDLVILSYSGHGLLSKDLDYYLSTYDINFSDPAARGLSYDALEGLVDGIRPRKKLVMIDACHSGEVDKEEIANIEAATKALDSLGTKTKSTIKITQKNKVGMRNSFELMQSLFVNVSRGTGATIISAAGGMQYAQERTELKNGVFTFSVIDALNKNQTLTVSQLKKAVGESVVQLTNGLQRPTSRNETNNYDWVVW